MTSAMIDAARLSNDRPLFAFAFRGGLVEVLHDFAEAEITACNGDFVWVHLDLRNTAAQTWLRQRPCSGRSFGLMPDCGIADRRN
jgi:hypothetical protein